MTQKPTKLFKYYKNRNYVLETLTNGQLHFSTADKFNDPYDCYIGINKREFYCKYFVKLLKESNNTELAHEFENEFLLHPLMENKNLNPVEEFVLLKSKKANLDLSPIAFKVMERYVEYVKRIYKLKKSVFICCFSNSDLESSMQMWAYYANNYNGYCCTYEIPKNCKTKKLQNLANLFYKHLHPITYTDQLINIDIDELIKLDPKKLTLSPYINQLIFKASVSKYKKWENESEYRLIFNKEDFVNAGGDLKTGQISFPFLTQLTLGRDIPKERQKLFLEKLKGVEINKISYSFNEYKLTKDWDEDTVYHNLKIKLGIKEE